MNSGTGTWITLTDWTPYSGKKFNGGVLASRYRTRQGPDGTIAFWHHERSQYTLTHHCPNGKVITVGPYRRANEAREAMRAQRRQTVAV